MNEQRIPYDVHTTDSFVRVAYVYIRTTIRLCFLHIHTTRRRAGDQGLVLGGATVANHVDAGSSEGTTLFPCLPLGGGFIELGAGPELTLWALGNAGVLCSNGHK